jgi:hypothetical protein
VLNFEGEENGMKRKGFWFFGIIAACSLVIGSCNMGGGGSNLPNNNTDGDSVKVDLSLPKAADLANFEGDFPSNKDDALELAIKAIAPMTSLDFEGMDFESLIPDLPIPGTKGSSSSYSRAVETVPIEYQEWVNESLGTGVTLTGFIQGSTTVSFKKDEEFSKGDYVEAAAQSKMAVDINIPGEDLSVKGKYTFDGDVYGKAEITALDSEGEPSKGRISGTVKLDTGYALSVSDKESSLGVKAIAAFKVSGKPNMSLTFSDYENPEFDQIVQTIRNSSLKISVELGIYDNNGKRRYTETYGLEDLIKLIEEYSSDPEGL